MIMATLLPIIGLSNVIGIQYPVTTKREGLLTRSVCIGAVANFVMNMILIPQLYSYGAAIASVISEVIITAVQLYFIRNELSIPKIFSLSWKYLVSAVCMLIVLLLMDAKLSVSFMHTMIMIVTGFIIYMVLLLLMRDEMVCEGIRLIKAENQIPLNNTILQRLIPRQLHLFGCLILSNHLCLSSVSIFSCHFQSFLVLFTDFSHLESSEPVVSDFIPYWFTTRLPIYDESFWAPYAFRCSKSAKSCESSIPAMLS